MRARGRGAQLIVALTKIALLLLIIDWWVGGRFFDVYVLPRYVTPFLLLRDRTGGQNPMMLFDALHRVPRRGLRVAFLGDSTMNALDGLDDTTIPYLTGQALRAQQAEIDAVDCSEIGLYAGDAALMVDKLVGARDVDVIVYGAALRAFPRAPFTRWVSRISEGMNVDDLWRIVRVGGGEWLRRSLSAEQVLTGVVRTHWATYAYRTPLRNALWERRLRPLVAGWPQLEQLLRPLPVVETPALAPRAASAGPYEWPRDEYGPPSGNWQALEVMGQLCARYAPGRCVFYAGPVNPVGRDHLVEPELYEEYLAHLRVVVGRYGIIWRDLTDSMTGSDFRPPKYGGLRDPIHMNEQGRAKLAKLLVAPILEAAANAQAVQSRHAR